MNHLYVLVTSSLWLQEPSEETGGDGINIMWLYRTACPFSGTHALNCAYTVIIYLDESVKIKKKMSKTKSQKFP